MRILKKVIKKLYHLIWFLSVCLIFTPCVFATTTIDGANYTQPAFVAFADNTNGHLTRINTTFVDAGSYYSSNTSIITNPASGYGANWGLYADIPFVQGHTYALSVLIGVRDTFAIVNAQSRARMCIAEGIGDAFTRYNNPGNFPCFSAWANSVNTKASYTDGAYTYQYTVLSYVFTADFTSNGITGVYSTNQYIESTHIFGGYYVEELSTQPLTQGQVQQAVQNSGLATANSVAQVQQGINEVKQELSEVSESVDNVNDTLNDSTVDSSDSTINNLKSKIPTNSVISDLLLLPVRFLQNFVNALGSSCSQFSLGSLYGTNLYMPCINIENYLGSGIWTTIDLIISGLFIYALRKKFIEIYENLTNLRNGGNEVD